MTKGQSARRWCPVHDRVFETADGLCPECGTALVDVEPRRPEDGRVVVPEAEDEPASTVKTSAPEPTSGDSFPIGPATLATVVTAVVVVAFLAGLAFPRGRRAGPSASATTPQSRADYTIGADRRGAGVRLQLRSFSQRGPRVVLRVALDPDAPVAPGHIDAAFVALSSGRSEQTAELEVRPTTYGFIAQGVAVNSDTIVTAIRIESLRASVSKAVALEIPIDQARVWRTGAVTDVTPRDRTFGDGRTLRRLTFVGWPDRLEARVEIAGERAGWLYDDAYELRRARLSAEGLLDDAPYAAGVRHVFFVAPRGDERSARLVIVRRAVLIMGNWRWALPSAASASAGG